MSLGSKEFMRKLWKIKRNSKMWRGHSIENVKTIGMVYNLYVLYQEPLAKSSSISWGSSNNFFIIICSVAIGSFNEWTLPQKIKVWSIPLILIFSTTLSLQFLDKPFLSKTYIWSVPFFLRVHEKTMKIPQKL